MRCVRKTQYDHPMPNPEPAPRRWAGRRDAAAYLGISVTSFWRLVEAGRITRYEIVPGQPKTARYDLNEIDTMVLACTPSGDTRAG